MNRTLRSQQGTTLMDTLVASLMLTAVLATMFSLYRYQMFSLQSQSVQLDTQQTARAILDLMAREVRQAGYDPQCTKAFEGLATGTSSNKVVIKFDRNGNGVIDADETVTYQIRSDDTKIKRVANGVTSYLALSDARTGSGFTFYDTTGTALNPGGSSIILTTAQRAAVRRIQIQLGLQQSDLDPNTSMKMVSSFSTNIDLRNRWMNGSTACP
jgi:type II secretory pathway component PulJ